MNPRAYPLGLSIVAAAGIVAVLVPVPDVYAFSVCAAAIVLGPAIPMLRLTTGLSWSEAFALGSAINIAGIMVIAWFMLMIDQWVPAAMTVGVLSVSLLASLQVLRKASV